MTRTERIAPLSGMVFSMLFVLAALLVNNYSYLPPAEDLQSFFVDGAIRIEWFAGYLGALSGVFLIWFAGSVRQSLRPAEGGTGRLSAVAFGGGALGGGLVVLAFNILAMGGARGGSEAGIGLETATIIYDLYGQVIGGALPIVLAAMIGAAAVVAFRTGTWPAWLAWSSAVFAVGSISPLRYIFSAADVLWILVVSVWLFRKQSTGTVGDEPIGTPKKI